MSWACLIQEDIFARDQGDTTATTTTQSWRRITSTRRREALTFLGGDFAKSPLYLWPCCVSEGVLSHGLIASYSLILIKASHKQNNETSSQLYRNKSKPIFIIYITDKPFTMTNRHIMKAKPVKEVKALTDKHPNEQQHWDQLVYHAPNDGTSGNDASTKSMVLMVDPSVYKEWKKGDKSIPIVNIVASYQVLKYESGRSGMLSKPSKQELDAVFQTTNMDKIIQIMLERGTLRNKML